MSALLMPDATDLIDEEEDVEEPRYCESCESLEDYKDQFSTHNLMNGDTILCRSCESSIDTCFHCSSRYMDGDAFEYGGESFCSGDCVDEYFHCENCEAMYSREDMYGEGYCSDCYDEKSDKSECLPRYPSIILIGAKGAKLESGVYHKVEVPCGDVSTEAQSEILRAMESAGLRLDRTEGKYPFRKYFTIREEIEWVATTRRGALPKRIAKWQAYHYSTKIDTALRSKIGDIVAQGTSKHKDYEIMFDPDLNKDECYFVNSGSCWWGDWSKSRCWMKDNGGVGVLIKTQYDGCIYGHSERLWLQPIKKSEKHTTGWSLDGKSKITPETPILLFNHYGRLQAPTAVRIVATLLGRTYEKVELSANDAAYINHGSGYVLFLPKQSSLFESGNIAISQYPACGC